MAEEAATLRMLFDLFTTSHSGLVLLLLLLLRFVVVVFRVEEQKKKQREQKQEQKQQQQPTTRRRLTGWLRSERCQLSWLWFRQSRTEIAGCRDNWASSSSSTVSSATAFHFFLRFPHHLGQQSVLFFREHLRLRRSRVMTLARWKKKTRVLISFYLLR